MKTWDSDPIRQALIERTRDDILDEVYDDDPFADAKRILAGSVTELLTPPPVGPPPPTIPQKVGRGVRRALVVLSVASVISAGATWYALDSGLITLAAAAEPETNALDSWTPPEDPTIPVDTSVSDYYYYQGLLKALEDAKNQTTDPGGNSNEQPTSPSDPDTKPGGTTTKPSGGSNPPPPSVPDDPILNSLSLTVTGGYQTLQVEAYVTSTGGAVTVTNPTATISGGIGTVSLSGPGVVDGSAWYTTSLSDVPAGEYSVTVNIGNLRQTNNITVY